jgi:hypothetical protein
MPGEDKNQKSKVNSDPFSGICSPNSLKKIVIGEAKKTESEGAVPETILPEPENKQEEINTKEFETTYHAKQNWKTSWPFSIFRKNEL